MQPVLDHPYEYYYHVKFINTLLDSSKVLSNQDLEHLINSSQHKLIRDAAEKILVERFFIKK